MIGTDEFNFRRQPANNAAHDIDEAAFIEMLPTVSGTARKEPRLLIDIVCPQPQSKRRSGTPAASGQSTLRAARTNSTNGWRK